MIEAKTKEYEIFNQKIIFQERSAQDVFDLVDFLNKEEGDDDAKGLYAAVYVIYSSALPYINKQKFFKRKKLRKLLNPKAIMDNLSPRQITEFSQMILHDLEGVNFDAPQLKKKIQKGMEKLATPLPKD